MRLYGMENFENWLEGALDRESRRSSLEQLPSPRYALQKVRRRRPILYALGGIAGSKLALAATGVAALAAVGIGTKAATTGVANPLDWGHTVTQQVQTCKANLATGEHGIGQCVSAVAKTHGAAVSDSHSHGSNKSGTATHTPGRPSPFPGQSGSHPTGPPSPFPGEGNPQGPPSPFPGQSGSHPTPPPKP
jgi:hypothetical protein